MSHLYILRVCSSLDHANRSRAATSGGGRKRRELEQQKRAEEAVQLRKAIQDEEKKLEQFNKWVDDWERAERLRRFIAVYAEKSHSWLAEEQVEHKAWIEWAQKQADRLDPFVSQKTGFRIRPKA
jgi:hypothetical protein